LGPLGLVFLCYDCELLLSFGGTSSPGSLVSNPHVTSEGPGASPVPQTKALVKRCNPELQSWQNGSPHRSKPTNSTKGIAGVDFHLGEKGGVNNEKPQNKKKENGPVNVKRPKHGCAFEKRELTAGMWWATRARRRWSNSDPKM